MRVGLTDEEIYDIEQQKRIAELEAELTERNKEIVSLHKILDKTIEKLKMRDDEITELDARLNITVSGNNSLSTLTKKQTAELRERDAKIAYLEIIKRAYDGFSPILHKQGERVKELEAELQGKEEEIQKEKQKVLDELLDRVNTMAIAYGQSQQTDSGKISMWNHITNIVSQYGFAEKDVSVNVDIPMNLALSAKIAIPCGWIINELVSNTYEHAFQDRGGIKITMKEEGNKIDLSVKNYGACLPKDLDFRETKSLGMQIVMLLVEQFEAAINIGETWFAITFKI
jgi:two-component sensor histidine kinase